MKRIRFTRKAREISEPLLAPLFDDMFCCEEMLSKSDTQFARRTYIRSVFALIEGFLYFLKGFVINKTLEKARDDGSMSITQIILLLDETHKVDRRGKIVAAGPNTIPFKNYCAFVLRSFMDNYELSSDKYFSENGWADLQSSLTVRHRITHPKKAADLEISDRDLHQTSEGIKWIMKIFQQTVLAANISNKTGDDLSFSSPE